MMATARPLSALHLNLKMVLDQPSSTRPNDEATVGTSPSSRDELLSISTTSVDDAFPDFEDPNLFNAASPDAELVRQGAGMEAGLGVLVDNGFSGADNMVSPSSSNGSESPISMSVMRGRMANYDLQRASFTAPSTASVSTTASVPFSSPASTPASASTSASASGSHRFLLPLPISTPAGNTSQASFAMSEVGDDEEGMEGFLAPEIAGADISISGVLCDSLTNSAIN